MRILFINNEGGGFADYVQVAEGTTVDKFFTASSFLKRTILSPISLITFSRLASSSNCKSWMSPSTSMTKPALWQYK